MPALSTSESIVAGRIASTAKRWLTRMGLALSLLGLAATVLLWIDSYWHARRIGWVSTQEHARSVTFTIVQLYNRCGQAELSFERRRHDGITLPDVKQRESYYTRDAGLFWISFPAQWEPHVMPRRRSKPSLVFRMIGFYSDTIRTPLARPGVPVRSGIAIGFPDWVPVSATGFASALFLLRVLRRRIRSHRGLCVNCGYDLRATSERCPECGTRISNHPGNKPHERASIPTGSISNR